VAKMETELVQYRINLGRYGDYIVRITPGNAVEVSDDQGEAVTLPPSPTFIRRWAEEIIRCVLDAVKVKEGLQTAIDWWETEGMRGVD